MVATLPNPVSKNNRINKTKKRTEVKLILLITKTEYFKIRSSPEDIQNFPRQRRQRIH